MEGLATASRFVQFIVSKKLLKNDPLRLIDVGCSGGIDIGWRLFDRDLIAFGFDPKIGECARLQREEDNPRVRYIPGFVGLPKDHPYMVARAATGPWGNNPWYRLSVAEVIDRTRAKTPDTSAGSATDVADPDKVIQLEQFTKQQGLADLDFIKIDVDGYDLAVLLSCESLFTNLNVLGVGIEVNYHGTASDTDHTFHNTDRFLRKCGFELFNLTVRRYSSKYLPSPFLLSIPAETSRGRPLQGDALYIRDLASPLQSDFAAKLSPAKLLKTACLFDIFRIPDGAAEILNVFADRLSLYGPIDSLLDQLVPEDLGPLSYRHYMERFEHDDPMFFPQFPNIKNQSLAARTTQTVSNTGGLIRKSARRLRRMWRNI